MPTAMLEIGFFLNTPDRRYADLARSLSLLLVQAVIPVLLFAIWYSHQAPGEMVTLSAALSQEARAEAQVLLAAHLSHGLYSMFQHLGVNGPRWTPWLKGAAQTVGYFLCAAFASIPLAVLLGIVKP